MRHQQIQTVIDNPETRKFLKDLFQKNLTEGTDKTSVLRFGEALVDILKDEVGSMRGKRSSSVDNGWRSEIKARFSGRGKQWIKVSLEYIKPYLDNLESEGIDVSNYRSWTTQAGFAWIRYAGSRVNDGVNSGGFEIRTTGSKIDHPKQLCYIPVTSLSEDQISDFRLSGTPFGMKLEEIREEVVEDIEEDEVATESDYPEGVFDCIEDRCVDPECDGNCGGDLDDDNDSIYDI